MQCFSLTELNEPNRWTCSEPSVPYIYNSTTDVTHLSGSHTGPRQVQARRDGTTKTGLAVSPSPYSSPHTITMDIWENKNTSMGFWSTIPITTHHQYTQRHKNESPFSISHLHCPPLFRHTGYGVHTRLNPHFTASSHESGSPFFTP